MASEGEDGWLEVVVVGGGALRPRQRGSAHLSAPRCAEGRHNEGRHPVAALGVPDVASGNDNGYLSLGCAGELVVEFKDNALVDVQGPDLYVFEIGPDVEPTALAVSRDGVNWIRVGRISGGKAEIDLAPYVSDGVDFRQVKLVDLKSGCDSRETPGADIDAVGAIGSARRMTLDSEVLFDSAESTLKDGAFAAIDAVLGAISNPNAATVVVSGHTDSVGAVDDNLALSQSRADAVRNYLVGDAGFDPANVSTQAMGESQPVGSNKTAEGRAMNRRVELTVQTAERMTAVDTSPVEILGVWDANDHGILELRLEDDQLIGEYSSDGGRIEGDMVGDTVIEGFWIENNSRRKCDSSRQGSRHWGALRIEFESRARDFFIARWRYCGEEEWRGSWKRAERLL